MANAIQRESAMTPTKLNQAFPSIEAVHVASQGELILIRQGDATITFPAPLLPNLTAALELAVKGDI